MLCPELEFCNVGDVRLYILHYEFRAVLKLFGYIRAIMTVRLVEFRKFHQIFTNNELDFIASCST